MKIEGIGEHVDLYFVADNERRDIFGDNSLMSDEDAVLTFFSGDDASLIHFDVTVHFLDREFSTPDFMSALFNVGIPDESFIHTWEWNQHICGIWFEFEGDFNGGFPALDRFIKVCESFKLTYEYKAEIYKNERGEVLPFDENAIIMYRSPFFTGNGDSMLTTDEVDLLIARGLIAPFSCDKVKVRDENGNVMTYGEYRKIHTDIIEF